MYRNKLNFKQLFLSKQTKVVVDVLMFLALVPTISFMHETEGHWKSAHCVFGAVLTVLMFIHMAQNWKFTKALAKKKVMKKNKITAFTTLFFILCLITIFLFAIGVFNIANLRIHNILGKLLGLFIIIHIIQKFKRFLALFKKRNGEI